MLFNSYEFLIFFPIVVLLYFIIPRKTRYIWLLISSYYFYMCWNPKYALLIAFSTFITYLSGRLLDRYKETKHKKWVVAGSFVINLAILVVFKYSDFLLQNINAILAKTGVSLIERPFDIILPVGISFYTFQALSYTMDVYRGEIKAEKNLLKYALFVSFFPQLVAGPIERSKRLLVQIEGLAEKKLWNYKRITEGLMLMLWGFFLKLMIADRIAILVDEVFDSYYKYGTIVLAVAAGAFAIQIYCDFSSYSTIAIGAAKVMDFELMENFNTPYFARSIQDFWRRWHISLSTWFRDYLYIPLGGSRCGKVRKYFNLMVTFLVSGLWHGANWTYVLWGGLHGLYQIIGDLTKPVKEKINQICKTKTESFGYKIGQVVITFVLVTFAWIFFRADSVTNAFSYIKRMFTKFDPWTFFDQSIYTLGLDRVEMNILLASLIALLMVSILQYIKSQRFELFLSEQCIWFRWLVIFALLAAIAIYGKYGPNVDAQAFIYFQF